MKYVLLLIAAISLGACSTSAGNDPVYAALKANPPTAIPAKHLPRLRRGTVSCDFFNAGQQGEYMTCWFPSGKPTKTAQLYFYNRIIRGGVYPSKDFITYVRI
ncbi:MAG: hypothetical protein ABJM47_01790 [Lentilitoribacter sp.]